MIAFIVIAAALVWAVLWIIFPVFVYFQLRDVIRALHQIERNTRQALPTPETRESLAEQSPS
ncbi:hypothetical protein SBV1_10010 [Verrucomicrobia bacterium]|nr:hypothetical protein SBV1_10010 [Verrucomicrobiota bacterium]